MFNIWYDKYPGVNLLVPIKVNLRKDMEKVNVGDWLIGGGYSRTPASFFDLLYDVNKLFKLNVVNLPIPVNRDVYDDDEDAGALHSPRVEQNVR